MVKDKIGSDDAMSTQLTGKKLRDRGTVLVEVDGKLIEIEQEGPEQAENVEQEQEYYREKTYGEHKVSEEELEEKRKIELAAARRAQKEQMQKMEKSQGKVSPNEKFDRIEQGVNNSKHGKPVHESKARQGEIESAEQDTGNKAAGAATLTAGAAANTVQLTAEQQNNLDQSVTAHSVSDNSGKGGPGVGI